MRDLITIVEAATIKSVGTGPGGAINRNKADRVEDPQGFFKNASSAHHNLKEDEIDERAPEERSVKLEWIVESYRKSDGVILSKKEFTDKHAAWDLAKQFKRAAGENTGVRIIDVTKTLILTKKVRNL